MTAVPERLSDAALIAAVRRGDTQAYGLLYERHLAAANRAASYLATTASEREDLVAEAFTRVLQVLRTGRGPAHDFRPYLLVTMRHAAINAARRSPTTALYADLPDAYLRSAIDDPVDARLHGNDAANAFAGLPERWRLVLWHTEVEGASPAAIAPLLGMTPNGVAALAYRAREGLRQAYLRLHLPAVERQDCREATDKLAGWVRRSISEPQQRKINAHLSRCPRCRELAAGLTEVNGELRAGWLMSWLSVLKSALSATTVKVGAAAAIAAVTAVGVVTSDLPHSPHGGDAGGPTGPSSGLHGPGKGFAGSQVRTIPDRVVASPESPPEAQSTPATRTDPQPEEKPKMKPDAPQPQSGSGQPQSAGGSGSAGGQAGSGSPGWFTPGQSGQSGQPGQNRGRPPEHPAPPPKPTKAGTDPDRTVGVNAR